MGVPCLVTSWGLFGMCICNNCACLCLCVVVWIVLYAVWVKFCCDFSWPMFLVPRLLDMLHYACFMVCMLYFTFVRFACNLVFIYWVGVHLFIGIFVDVIWFCCGCVFFVFVRITINRSLKITELCENHTIKQIIKYNKYLLKYNVWKNTIFYKKIKK